LVTALIFCGDFLRAPDIVIQYLIIALQAYLAVFLGRLIIKLLSVLIDTLDALSLQYSNPDNVLRHYERFRHLVPALKKALEYIVYVAIATLVIQDIDSTKPLSQPKRQPNSDRCLYCSNRMPTRSSL